MTEEEMKKLFDEEYYEANLTCTNCGKGNAKQFIRKGQFVSQQKCIYCGCQSVILKSIAKF